MLCRSCSATAEQGEGKVPSVTIGALFIALGLVFLMIDRVADLISFNRQLAEVTLERVRRIEANVELLRTGHALESKPVERGVA